MASYWTVFVLLLLATAARATLKNYDDARAEELLFLSYASYCAPTNLESWDCKWCNTTSLRELSVVQNSEYELLGYVGYNPSTDQIVVVYRGTRMSDLENWIQDLKLAKTKEAFIPNALVHLGFFEDYTALKPEMNSALQSLLDKHPQSSILVTGHSLGAALGTLLVADYLNSNTESARDIELWTFGSPRVGNSVFSDWLQNRLASKTSFRVVNHKDVVPHLPPQSFGFHHIPTEVWFSDATSYQICSSANGEDPSCSDSLLLPDSPYDHLHYLGFSESCD